MHHILSKLRFAKPLPINFSVLSHILNILTGNGINK